MKNTSEAKASAAFAQPSHPRGVQLDTGSSRRFAPELPVARHIAHQRDVIKMDFLSGPVEDESAAFNLKESL